MQRDHHPVIPDPGRHRLRSLHLPLGVLLGVLAGELAYLVLVTISVGVIASGALAAVLAALLSRMFAGWFRERAPLLVGPTSFAVFATLAAFCAVQTARAAGFAVDAKARQYAIQPWDEVTVHHNCFTAYYEAAQLAHIGGINIYDDRSYFRRPGENERPPWVGPEDPRRLVGGMFFVDGYEYPPPFLVIPMTMIALGADFLQARTVWFALQVAVVVSALLIVAFHIGGEVGVRFGLLAPVVYLAIPMQTGLQWGNFQPGAVALALIAMVAMSRKREVLGAILLGFVVLAKLFPGILLLVLAARRQWRALNLTVCAMAAWSVVAVVVLGPEPFVDFVRFHLPRMASGEAFGMLHVPFVAALNHSVYGLPLKLRFFGIDHGSFASSATLAWVYTIVPCAAALVLGRRLGPRSTWTRSSAEVVLWIFVIMLANLRAPFLPQEYAAIGPIWLAAILAAIKPLSRRRLLVFAGLAVVLQLFAPWQLLAPELISTPFSPDARNPWTYPIVSLIALAAQMGIVALSVLAARTLQPLQAAEIAPAV